MIKPNDVIALDEVADDLNSGSKFYSEQEIWLGEYFWDSLLSDIESLYLYAGIHGKHFGLFRMLSNKFPYALYYDIEGTVVSVLAVLPMKRAPAWIRETLKGRGN